MTKDMLSHSFVVEMNWNSRGGGEVGLKCVQHGIKKRLTDVQLNE